MERPRVVITGLGVISALGCTLKDFWNGLKEGRSGIGPISQFDASEFPCRIAGEVKDFDPQAYMDRTEVRRTPRSTHLAVAAARSSLDDAGYSHSLPDPERVGVFFGTGVAGLGNITKAFEVMRSKGYSRMNPFQLPSGIPNMPAAQIAKEFLCLGPNNTTTTACAAGTQAIGEGSEYIRRGVADIVIAGGAEAIVTELVIGAFSVMKALPFDFNDRAQAASRPFDIARQGFVIAEGAAALILEKLEHALARGARIYAEVLGHASSSDGYHMIAMNPDGLGPTRAMQWALTNAGVAPDDVDYINAHGTSTPLNDATETKAIKQVFGEKAYDIAVSSTKSMIGHSMGAAGALEAVASALTIFKGWIHPTINYEHPDPECDLYYVPNKAVERKVDVALSNSFGLGGQNACLVLGRYHE